MNCLRRGVTVKRKKINYYVVSMLLAVFLVACNGAKDTKNAETTTGEQEVSGEMIQSEDSSEGFKENEDNDDSGSDKQDSIEQSGSTEETKEQPTEEETFSQPEIELIMVGDVLLHDRLEACAKQEDGSYRYEALFAPMKDEIQAADLAIVNQEVLIGGEELGITGYPCFNAPFTLGDALVDAGFDVVCHATNHTMDKQKRGLLSCINFWKTSYPDIAVLGMNETQEERDEIYIYEQEGIKVAILNYTYGTNGIKLPSDMPFAVNLLDEEKVVADIKKAEELADFTIVCPHWGTEYVLKQTKEQERWAKIFFDNGVDLVIGTHPHVIEPVEMMYDVTTGHKMLVYYSLGNFVNWSGESRDGVANRFLGGMAKVTISLDEGGNPMIADYGVIATVTHVENKTNGVYTTRLSEYTQELSLTSEVIKQDDVFSKEYLEGVADKVWGDLWE